MFTWEFDAEDGVYKSHTLSNEMLKVAARKLVMVRFTKKQEGFGAGMGQSVTLVYYKPAVEPTSANLSEHIRIPIDQLVMDGRTITPVEMGRGVSYTKLSQEFSKFKPSEGGQKVLIDQMHGCLDTAAAAGFKESKLCYTPTSASGGVMDTDGAHSTQALSNLKLAHLAIIRDYMANDIHAPFFESGHYVGAMTTKALRGITSDSNLIQWAQYLGRGDMLYRNERGMLESIRLVEITHENALSNSVGSGDCLGEGLVFGDDPVRRVEVEAPHLRANPNYQDDFGRRKAIIWYGIVAFGSTFLTADDREGRIIRIGSDDS